jgi:DNA-binding transcriptional LysR family regulator
MGLTRLLSYQVAEAKRAGRLELVLEHHEPPPWPVSLVYEGQQLLPKKTRAFLDFVAPRLKHRLLEEIAILKSGEEAIRSGG